VRSFNTSRELKLLNLFLSSGSNNNKVYLVTSSRKSARTCLEKSPTFGSRRSWRTLKDGCREVTGHRGQHSPLPLATLHTGKDTSTGTDTGTSTGTGISTGVGAGAGGGTFTVTGMECGINW
jgi:hypothetical protein